MPLPITIPYTFATATTSIPLSQLDSDFSTVANAINGIGNGTNALSNVVITGGTIDNVAIGATTSTTGKFTTVTATTGNITTINATTLNAATHRSDGNLTFQSNGTITAMTINTSQNVGIGTTSPTAKLDVNGAINGGYSYINVFSPNGSNGDWVSGYNINYSAGIKNVATGASCGTYYNNGTVQFYTNTSQTGGTAVNERMRIDSSGNLLLNTTTANGMLSIDRGTSASAIAYFKNNATNGAWTAYDYNGTVYGYIGSGSNLVTGAATSDFVLRSTANMIFGVGTAEKMRIDSNGNVGIGATPSADTTYKWLNIVGPSTSGGGIVQLNNSDSSVGINMFCNNLAGYVGTSTAHPLLFRINSSEVARIDSSGNLLVNTTTKYGKITSETSTGFDPTASSNITNCAISAHGSYGGGISVIDGTQGYTMWAQTSGADFYIRRATTTGSYTGGVYISNAATSWSAASDERLKNIIKPIENATQKLSSLRCVIGEYKDNIGAHHPFLIAQDVQSVFPEVVNQMDEQGHLGMSYTDMVPILVKAIQELKAELDALKGAK